MFLLLCITKFLHGHHLCLIVHSSFDSKEFLTNFKLNPVMTLNVKFKFVLLNYLECWILCVFWFCSLNHFCNLLPYINKAEDCGYLMNCISFVKSLYWTVHANHNNNNKVSKKESGKPLL